VPVGHQGDGGVDLGAIERAGLPCRQVLGPRRQALGPLGDLARRPGAEPAAVALEGGQRAVAVDLPVAAAGVGGLDLGDRRLEPIGQGAELGDGVTGGRPR
jgi:hypothetical protein